MRRATKPPPASLMQLTASLLDYFGKIEVSLAVMRELTPTFEQGQPVRTVYRGGGSWAPHGLRAVVISVEAPPASRFVRVRVTKGRHGVPVGRILNLSPFALVKLPSKRRR